MQASADLDMAGSKYSRFSRLFLLQYDTENLPEFTANFSCSSLRAWSRDTRRVCSHEQTPLQLLVGEELH